MKVLVYGAGVQGSVVAACLHRAGHDVKILARGQRLRDIREHGIVLEKLGGPGRQITPVPAVERLAPSDDYDLVLVMMQRGQVGDVLPILAANAQVPSVAFFQNRVTGPGELVHALGAHRVLLGFAVMGGVRDGPLVRWASEGGRAHLFDAVMGEVDGSDTPRLRSVVEAFAEARIRMAVEPHMDAWLKAHWALVGPMASALDEAGNDNYRLAKDRDALRRMTEAQKEGFRGVRALGLPLVPTRLKLIAWLPTWVSVAVGRRLLNTEFAELALAGHAGAGQAEFEVLTREFRELIEGVGVPAAAPTRPGMERAAPRSRRGAL